MLPKPVADRAAAVPGDSEYSALSVMCRVSCRVFIEFGVGRNNFEPQPKIDSKVVKFIKTGSPPAGEFLETVKASFSRRRKKIKNILSSYFSVPAAKVETALAAAGISPEDRPQSIDCDRFKKLSDELIKQGIL